MKLSKRAARRAHKAAEAAAVTSVEKTSQEAFARPNSIKSATLSLSKIAVVLIAQLPLHAAYPISTSMKEKLPPHEDPPLGGKDFWINMGVSAFLVLMGGIFAGLTLGLMGQDEVYLQVIQQTGEESERRAAGKVLSLLKRGKHWVLVTLLLSNVITNESLPIVLDRCLGGGWPAVVSSTVAIVIFGEIIPQSVSVRYGLGIGATFSPFVLALMYIMYPVAYPIAMLLDYTLGEDHGTIYKRAGLKSLVGLHKTMGAERLSEDEVTIITAVLDLKDKAVQDVMTPMADVFTMSSDRILDEETIEEILQLGFSRIPIHVPNEPTNFIGMLLVRTLITYDPEDAFPISSFPLATLPETKPDTSCLNILNYFQEGKSHMVVVSLTPGGASGALGVLTLEDVIEELIGEEIIDESDVYVDVHKAIKRVHPNPLKRVSVYNSFAPRNNLGFENVLHALIAQDAVVPADGHAHPAIKPKFNPLNKASNPQPTTNSKVTIKRAPEASPTPHSSHAIKTPNGRKAQPEMAFTPSDYGSIHPSEAEAVASAARVKSSHEPATGQYFEEEGLGSTAASPGLHSYRTGGLIESVVKVQGVSKTIIEDTASTLNVNGNGATHISGTPSVSSRGSRKSDDEQQPLLK